MNTEDTTPVYEPDFELDSLELAQDSPEGEQEQTNQEPQTKIEVDENTEFFYNEFKGRGLIVESEEDKFDGTPEWIDKKLQEYPEVVKSQILSNIPEKHKTFVELVLTKPNLTEEDFEKFYQEHLSEASQSINTLDDAREFMEKHLATSGLRQSAIKAQLDEMEDDETLLEEAKKLAGSKKTKISAELEQVKQREQEEQVRVKTFMENITQEINQFPEPRKKAILAVAPQVGNIINEISSDPKIYAQFLDLLTYYKNGTFDFSAFEKQGTTKAVNSFKERINQSAVRPSRASGSPNKANFDFELVI